MSSSPATEVVSNGACLGDASIGKVHAQSATKRRLSPLFGSALGLAFILPFLNYLRVAPIGDFFGEWLSVVAFALAALALSPHVRGRAPLNWAAFAGFAAVAAVILVQVAVGKYAYPEQWLIWVAYLTVACFATLFAQIVRASDLQAEATRRVAWALVVAALANLILQVLQAARMDVDWAPFVVRLFNQSICRIYGNVGQANHANTLAWLGLAGAVYLIASKSIGKRAGAVIIGPLMVSSALTGSRMAWLFLAAFISALSVPYIWPGFDRRSRMALGVTLIVGLALATWAMPTILANVSHSCTSVVDRFTDSSEAGNVIRPLLWKQAVDVWQMNPWLGAGAGGFIGAVYQADIGEGQQPLDAWVHNTALQLLAEFGLVAVVLLAAIALHWLLMILRNRRCLGPEDSFCLSVLAVLSLHSLLEFPLWYAHFLVLAALCLGLLLRPAWTRIGFAIPARASTAALALLTLIGSATLMRDYLKLDRLHAVSTFVQGLGVGSVPDARNLLNAAARDVRFFGPRRDYELSMAGGLSNPDLEQGTRIADRALGAMPNVNIVHVRILQAVLANDLETARSHLRRVFKYHSQHADAVIATLRARIKARPEKFSGLDPILEEEILRRPQPRW